MPRNGTYNKTEAYRDVENYNIITDMLKAGQSLRARDVADRLNIPFKSAETILMNLSFELPIWNPDSGLYKLLTDEDLLLFKD